MQCDDAEQILAEVFDASLDSENASQLHFHLEDCADCRDLLADLLLLRAVEGIVSGDWEKRKTFQVS